MSSTDMYVNQSTESTGISIAPTVSGPGYTTFTLSPMGYNIFGFCLSTVFLVGSVTNGTGLLIFLKNKQLRSPTNIFIMNLAIADFLMCFIGVQGSMWSSYSHGWIWGDLGCVIEGGIVFLLGLAQLYLLCAVAFDRYIVIAKPLLSSKITPTVAMASSGLCWAGGLFWAGVPLLGWNYYRPEGSMVTCSVAFESDDPSVKSYVVAIFFFCLLIPLGVICYSYFHVFMTVSIDTFLLLFAV